MTAMDLPAIATCSWTAYRREYGTAVRISLGVPRIKLPDPRYTDRAHYIYVAELAPRRAYWDAPDFDERYLAQVAQFADAIDAKLSAIEPENGALCLLCWEKQVIGPEQCHRRLAAAFLSERYGVEIPEMDAAPGGCR